MNIFSSNAIKIVGVLCCLLIITACGGEAASDEGVPTEAALAPVVVVIATETPTPEVAESIESETAVSETETEEDGEEEDEQQATITTLVALNVRDEPSTAGEVVYVLDEGTTVEVVGESDDGNWWEIVCAVETVSECWTSSSTDYSVYNDGGDGTEETAVSSTDSSSESATATPTTASSSSEEATATATTAAAEATATTAATAEPTATSAQPQPPRPPRKPLQVIMIQQAILPCLRHLALAQRALAILMIFLMKAAIREIGLPLNFPVVPIVINKCG